MDGCVCFLQMDANEEKAGKSQKSIATVVVFQGTRIAWDIRISQKKKKTLIAFIACMHFISLERERVGKYYGKYRLCRKNKFHCYFDVCVYEYEDINDKKR